uniref:Uncharacterized protein n=1 Tax=Romanomermis culicivorax TaxID=13658 RepID=A0A915KM74_ROMCU
YPAPFFICKQFVFIRKQLNRVVIIFASERAVHFRNRRSSDRQLSFYIIVATTSHTPLSTVTPVFG